MSDKPNVISFEASNDRFRLLVEMRPETTAYLSDEQFQAVTDGIAKILLVAKAVTNRPVPTPIEPKAADTENAL